MFLRNQAVLHRNSDAMLRARAPRQSMAFEFQRADIAPIQGPPMAVAQAAPGSSSLAAVRGAEVWP